MYLYYRLLLVSVILSCCQMYTMDPQPTKEPTVAISFDVDGVLSHSVQINKKFLSPDWIEKLSEQSPLSKSIHENATFNQAVALELNSPNPIIVYPVMPFFALIEALRRNGHPVVAATNQPIHMHMLYRQKLREQHNLDLGDRFDAILTTLDLSAGVSQAPSTSVLDSAPSLCNHVSDNTYSMAYVDLGKPDAYYYRALQSLVQKKHPSITKTIHIDDAINNVSGVQTAYMHGIHFDIDVSTADLATIAAAINKVKEALKAYGINAD